jgi:hypothetical protein
MATKLQHIAGRFLVFSLGAVKLLAMLAMIFK